MNSNDTLCNVERAGSNANLNMFSSSRESAIDRSVLTRLNALVSRDSDEPFAVRAARIYLKSSAKLVANMKAGLTAQDAKAVCFAVHTLKSSSNSLGARTLGQRAADLEILTHRGTLDGAAEQVDEITREYHSACDELNQFIDESMQDVVP